jgi:hypothetical protein
MKDTDIIYRPTQKKNASLEEAVNVLRKAGYRVIKETVQQHVKETLFNYHGATWEVVERDGDDGVIAVMEGSDPNDENEQEWFSVDEIREQDPTFDDVDDQYDNPFDEEDIAYAPSAQDEAMGHEMDDDFDINDEIKSWTESKKRQPRKRVKEFTGADVDAAINAVWNGQSPLTETINRYIVKKDENGKTYIYDKEEKKRHLYSTGDPKKDRQKADWLNGKSPKPKAKRK